MVTATYKMCMYRYSHPFHLMMFAGFTETTLSTLEKCANMDEEPALKRTKSAAVTAKKTNVVTFK